MLPIGRGGPVDDFFFFQAEDGIRDLTVTGVQTCALPIFAVRTVTENVKVVRFGGRAFVNGCKLIAMIFGVKLELRCRLTEAVPFIPMGNLDRKSTRLNSSHSQISYAVFCLKKKKNKTIR